MRPLLASLFLGVVLLPGVQHGVADLVDGTHGMHSHCHLVFEDDGRAHAGHGRPTRDHGHGGHAHESRGSHGHAGAHARAHEAHAHGSRARAHEAHAHGGHGAHARARGADGDRAHEATRQSHADVPTRPDTSERETRETSDTGERHTTVVLPRPCSEPDHEGHCPHAPLSQGHSHAMPPMLPVRTPSALWVWNAPRVQAFGETRRPRDGRDLEQTLERPPRA